MPQIANQDYIYLFPKAGREAAADAELLVKLCEAVERNTIFDYLVNISGYYISRITNYEKLPHSAYSSISLNCLKGGSAYYLGGYVDARGYSALARIQEQQDILKGGVMQSLPALSISNDGILYTKNTSGDAAGNGVIVSPDGFAYEATAAGGPPKFTKVSKSSTTAEEAKSALSLDNVIVLSEEDAAALIGYIKS